MNSRLLLLLAATVCVVAALLSGRGSAPAHGHNTQQVAPRIAEPRDGGALSRSHHFKPISGATKPQHQLLRKSKAAEARDAAGKPSWQTPGRVLLSWESSRRLWRKVTAALESMSRARPPAVAFDMWRNDLESDAGADSDACAQLTLDSKQQQVCAISI